MKRILASSLGMTLGLLASAGRADDPVWRAPRDRGPQPVTAAPLPPIVTLQPTASSAGVVTAAHMARWLGDNERPAVRPAVVAAAAVGNDITWVRVRAQSAEDEPAPETPESPSAQVYGTVGLAESVTPAYQPPAAVGTELPSRAPTSSVSPSTPATADACAPCVAPAVPMVQPSAGPGRAPWFLVSAEYLLWWTKQVNSVPLVTTSPPGTAGILPGAAVLASTDDLDRRFRQGGRFGVVLWCDCCASFGFDGRYFFTAPRSDTFSASAPPSSDLFRPFFAGNVLPPLFPGEFTERVAGGGSTIGSIRADNRSEFWGAEANYRDNLICRTECCRSFRADLLLGFRYLNLDEDLTIVEDFTRLTPTDVFDQTINQVVTEPAGTRVVIRDRFATSNDFYGGQIGTVVEYRRNRWTLDMRSAVALGTTHQRLRIEGDQVRTLPGQAPLTFVGGLYALDSNIGDHSRNVFSVVPELGVNVGYQMTDHLRAYVGYNFLYWSNVIRPADQIDRVIDVNRVPRFVPPPLVGAIPPIVPPRPAVLFKETDFWVQGVNLGVEYRW
jgi:hypothetical protein